MFNLLPSSLYASREPVRNAKEAHAEIKISKIEMRRMLARIEKASRLGHDRKARTLVSAFLKSRQCKIAAMHHANRNRGRAKDTRLSDIKTILAAETMSVWHPCKEPCSVFGKRKPSGASRTLTSFDLYNRARQYLVREALVAMHSHSFGDWQFGSVKGTHRGRDAAIQSLSDKIKSGEVEYFAEIDIDNFFGSIDAMKLSKEIGLPTKVIRYVLCADAYLYRPCKGHNRILLEACRNGIPQGSLASPIVAAIVISKVMKDRDVQSFVNYADNFAVFGKTKEEVAKLALDLQVAIRDSRYGTFSTSKVQDRGIAENDGFDFLYQVSRIRTHKPSRACRWT